MQCLPAAIRLRLGALGVAHQAGRRVPEDLAIVGFDNMPESEFFWPPLTTVYQQLSEVGSAWRLRSCIDMIECQRKDEAGELRRPRPR